MEAGRLSKQYWRDCQLRNKRQSRPCRGLQHFGQRPFRTSNPLHFPQLHRCIQRLRAVSAFLSPSAPANPEPVTNHISFPVPPRTHQSNPSNFTMPWSDANPPKLPEHELTVCPHSDRTKSAKLAKFSDPVWAMELPDWLLGPPGGLDPRIVCLLFSAAAVEIEASLNAGHQSWSDVCDAIMRCPDQASLTKNTKDVEHSIDALVQRLTLSRFPSFSSLSPGQIRTAAGFANLNLPDCLVR